MHVRGLTYHTRNSKRINELGVLQQSGASKNDDTKRKCDMLDNNLAQNTQIIND